MYLSVQLQSSFESPVAGNPLKKYLRLAGEVTEVLWTTQLRQLRQRVGSDRRKVTYSVNVPESLHLSDDVVQVLGLGPKFAVEKRMTKPELLSVVRRVSRKATDGEEARLTSEGVDALGRCKPNCSKLPLT
ncbi:hypothetical protein HPB52_007539 [Rhipicephalus sanguineus]|uniref:Uncharacterized protein n=1 Tax=Rhipicephalus sanguineus TaxID=34632 RepID=A0A9D4PN33_RHISA|nr:hypothetical protein HPB52_007539 [Rhipicephalus sanguineus]